MFRNQYIVGVMVLQMNGL